MKVMQITKFDCLDLAKLISSYTKKGAPDIKEFNDFYAIYVKGVEIMTISKQGNDFRINKKANLNSIVMTLIDKSIEWLKFKNRYE